MKFIPCFSIRSAAAGNPAAMTALLAFERAASQLSFRRAARDLSLSPSAISHQIRGLEQQQFGVKLFVRGARSVRLTADGERYLAKVSSGPGGAGGRQPRPAAAAPRHRQRALDQRAAVLHLDRALIPALPEFRRRHPGLTLRIEATHQYADFNASRSRRRHPLWPRTFHRVEIRAVGRGQGICRSARRRWSRPACARLRICRARC